MSAQGVETVVRERLGLDPAALGPTILPRTIENRVKAKGEKSSEAYAESLSSNPQEIEALAEELVVSETWFFRGGQILYQALAQVVQDCATSHPSKLPIRILSLPCSTGEEPLSLAIALHKIGMSPNSYEIDAVDLSRTHIEKATAGLYPKFTFREPGPDIRPSFFDKIGTSWMPHPYLRKALHFQTGNIVDPSFSLSKLPYDVILCRNLFIYLTVEARKKAIVALDQLLARDGCLCVTSAEADRLPSGQFIPEGPIEFGIYRRNEPASNNASPKQQQAPSPKSKSSIQAIADANRLPLKPDASPPPTAVLEINRHRSEVSELKSSGNPDTASMECITMEKARKLANAGRLTEAKTLCEQLIRDQSELADVYSLLGVIHQSEGRFNEAAEAFRKALYLAPNHLESLTHMIVLCNARGDTPQATVLQKRLKRLTREEDQS